MPLDFKLLTIDYWKKYPYDVGKLHFPRDEGKHDFLHEWWYINLHLVDLSSGVKYAFDHVGTKDEDKKYILFSKSNSSHDYGHLDLNMGKKAKEEVYPRIYSWIKKREMRCL